MSAADDGASVIEKYRARIPELMAEQGIPGVAVALVDGDHVLWTEGFGHLDRDGEAVVTTDTIFSVQSMSKAFTATAVMQAVQDGRLVLDEPITTYLPEFTVNSAFEEHPERKITLRMLLSHTAGFTHEAPIGNNFEIEPGDFDAHVRSISDTWLRFPVGRGYAYSNLGIDLAGYILERVYGARFAVVMHDLLLDPLGMDRSTFDRAQIRATTDRAVGHIPLLREVPVDVPMTAAGGLYASATDLARFLSFQLSGRSIDGETRLDPRLMTEMRTIPAPNLGASAGYALGVGVTRWRAGLNADLYSHGGGGYGFLSDLWWLPQLKLGIALLTNSQGHQLQADLALSILTDLVNEPGSAFRERMLGLPVTSGPVGPDESYQPPTGMAALIAGAGMPPRGDESTRWASYAGHYWMFNFGAIDPSGTPERFLVDSGVPFFETSETGTLVRHRLTEVDEAVFLADDGQTLDLRGDVPTWRSIDLVRAAGGPSAWQWGIFGIVALISLLWLIAAMVRTLRSRRTGTAGVGEPPVTERWWRRVAAAVATMTVIAALATIALVTAVPALVDSGFLGWVEFPVMQRLALHLPLALTILAACLSLLAAAGWARRWWPRAARLEYAALAIAAVTLVGQLAAWRLIGWGLT